MLASQSLRECQSLDIRQKKGTTTIFWASARISFAMVRTCGGIVDDGDDAVVVGVGEDDPHEGEESDAVETVDGLGTLVPVQHLGHVGQQGERLHQRWGAFIWTATHTIHERVSTRVVVVRELFSPVA